MDLIKSELNLALTTLTFSDTKMNKYLLIFYCMCILFGYLLYYVPQVQLFNLTIPMTFPNEGNYATFDPPENLKIDLNEFHFQVYFKTLKDSGLILMVQTVNLGYLLVYLEQGLVKVILAPEKKDAAVHLQSHSANLNDGTDHKLGIRVSRFSNKVDLYVNENKEVSVEAGIHERPLSKIAHICLGGLSPQVKESYKDTFDHSLYTSLTFKGCLVEPRINSRDIIGPAFLHDIIYGCLDLK